jgi:hypothetical protein
MSERGDVMMKATAKTNKSIPRKAHYEAHDETNPQCQKFDANYGESTGGRKGYTITAF